MHSLPVRSALPAGALLALFMAIPAAAAAPDTPTPTAQAWIDVATFSGMGMPMPGMATAGDPAAALGALFGGKGGAGGGNAFGNTRAMNAGRWVDVTVHSRAAPALERARQAVPAGFLASPLELRAQQNARPAGDEEEVAHASPEKPKGRVLLYWGCGSEVRQGQPRVLDMASASSADFTRFFVGRSATRRGAHAAAGRPLWPNQDDSRMVPATASLVGEHAFSGTGIPDGFRFKVPPAQDLMPALALEQAARDGATGLSWNSIPTARAYFVSALGGTDKDDMVIWTSSEVPDSGFGLLDYQTNAAIDRWLKEKVLLAPTTTSCSLPKGIFGENGAMLRLIAYGEELNLAHPPRPKDPKARWDPLWTVKLRVKSVANGFLGMAAERGEARRERDKSQDMPTLPQPVELLKGIFGR